MNRIDPELLNICQELGSPAECNGPYQHLFYERIKETGVSIESMSVQELLEIIRKTNIEFNNIQSQPQHDFSSVIR